MPQAAGFYYDIRQTSSELPPLILLHGSGGTEADLIDFSESISPNATYMALRGGIPWEGGFAFFRRNPDRTLDENDLNVRTADLCNFIAYASSHHGFHRAPILVGYSNGAIISASAICHNAEMTSGAILLRPLSPSPDKEFPALANYPVLILAGQFDNRRSPEDAPIIEEQFRRSRACVSYHMLPTGHGWHEAGFDQAIAKSWVKNHFAKNSQTVSGNK